MSQSKKHIKVKGGADKASVIQSSKSGEEDIRKLYFMKLELSIQSQTYEAIHELKRVAEVDISRVLSFLLDAGSIVYNGIKVEMNKKLKEQIKKE